MKIYHVDAIPSDIELVMYNGPWTSTVTPAEISKVEARIKGFYSEHEQKEMKEMAYGLACSIKEYQEKYGEPKIIYILHKNIFIVKEKQ